MFFEELRRKRGRLTINDNVDDNVDDNDDSFSLMSGDE